VILDAMREVSATAPQIRAATIAFAHGIRLLGVARGLVIERENRMGLVLLVVLVLLLIGALPTWGYSRKWGYAPTGGLGLVLVILLILVLFNVIPRGF
jgi:hypothetical protein